MRLVITSLAALLIVSALAEAQKSAPKHGKGQVPQAHNGFDRNDYPGDATLPILRQHFSFTGYWLNNPPGEQQNTWAGKRQILRRSGFGFLVLFNGKVDAEIVKAQRAGIAPATLGRKDAATAIASARREHFPPRTILFLDQEEGGRLLPEQSAYLLAWTEAVARSSYRPGVYLSGQPVSEGDGQTVTTAQDIRSHVAREHLHRIALFVYQDACPPSNGCTLSPPAIRASGTPDAVVWQYAQSPRRTDITRSCARTYSTDGNCYVADLPKLPLDLSVSVSSDPSRGR